MDLCYKVSILSLVHLGLDLLIVWTLPVQEGDGPVFQVLGPFIPPLLGDRSGPLAPDDVRDHLGHVPMPLVRDQVRVNPGILVHHLMNLI